VETASAAAKAAHELDKTGFVTEVAPAAAEANVNKTALSWLTSASKS
jgi:hypothetical protein